MQTSELAVQEYFQRKTSMSGWGAHRTLAWVFLPMGVVGLCLGLRGLAMCLVWGTLNLFIASWARKNPIVRLLPTHLELKPAPLASLRLVRYTEIERVETVSPTRANLCLKEGAALRLPVAALEPQQRTALTAAIGAKIGTVS